MNREERVQLLANALLSEISRAYMDGEGEESVGALIEMRLSNILPELKQFCGERFIQGISNKSPLGMIKALFIYTSAMDKASKELNKLIEWAGKIVMDRLDVLSVEEIKDYGRLKIDFSLTVRSVLEDMYLEMGL